MKLYVANCTLQYHVFNYRLPERNNPYTQSIASGRQVRLAGDMGVKDIEAIITQSHKYGLRTVEEARSLDEDIPITFVASVDKPVTDRMMKDVIMHNRGVLTFRGKKMRELAALAASSNMESQAHTPNAANQLELSIEEQTTSTLDGADESLLGEGYRVGNERGGEGGGGAGGKRVGGRRGKRG